MGVLCLLLLAAFLAALVWGANHPSVRIAEIRGVEESRFLEVAEREIAGSYLGLIPRNSIFFFPERTIRARILAESPEIAAVSIARSTFTSIKIQVSKRAPIARWCGLSKTPEPVDEYCYFFDASGFIYAAEDPVRDAVSNGAGVATTTPPLHAFSIYGKLAGNTEEPLRATLEDAKHIPPALDFARELPRLGGKVETITFRGDEVDVLLQSGTRLTYVRGEEEKAFAALVSSKENIDLSDGSLEYVDLRFDGKVYLKRKE